MVGSVAKMQVQDAQLIHPQKVHASKHILTTESPAQSPSQLHAAEQNFLHHIA